MKLLLFILIAIFPQPLLASESDSRLLTMSETYAKSSREIIHRAAEQKFNLMNSYRSELKMALIKMNEEPEMVFIPGERKGETKGIRADPKYKSAKAETALNLLITDIKSGIVTPEVPPGLNKNQESRHREYVASMKKAGETAAREMKILDQQYLAALSKLQPTDAEPETKERIEQQMAQVRSGTPCALGDLREDLIGTRWELVSNPAEFIYFDSYHLFEGRGSWFFRISNPDTVVVRWKDPGISTWVIGEDRKTLLKDGAPFWRLVHPMPLNFAPLTWADN